MDERRRKYLLVIVVAAVILLGSSYSYWQQSTLPHQASIATESPLAIAKMPDADPVVYVSGFVVKPGVMRIAENSRVIDAVNAAGGLAIGADVSRVNLAQKVKDGMHIQVPGSYVPSGPGAPAATGGSNGTAVSGDKININTADKNQLDSLPGIGPALADRIIQYRQENGMFSAIEDIQKVSGVGAAKFNQLKDRITI
ncbi:ComEA family DNA-binding protein [Acetonema longum]|uniref:ComEA protein n=1 Tax=Acetonema longum DSM 6540 TaxID=1009370 RepID=F7NKU8_9FIRM|nr:ComEA family DNA-binding protein [Acetonema longum]EGO63291.1 ComEA protein [Acetonema longum DSM 6540]